MKISSSPFSPALLIAASLGFVSCTDSKPDDGPVVDVDKIRKETQQRIDDAKQPLKGVLVDENNDHEDRPPNEATGSQTQQSTSPDPVIDPDAGEGKAGDPAEAANKKEERPNEGENKASGKTEEIPEAKVAGDASKNGQPDGGAKRLKVIDKPFGSKPIDDHLKEFKALIALYTKKVELALKGEDTKQLDTEMKKRAEAFNSKGNLVREAVNKLTPKEGTRFNLLVRVNNAELERLALKLKQAKQ